MEIFFLNPRNNKKDRVDKKDLPDCLEKKQLHILIEFKKERIIGLIEVKPLLTLYKEMLNIVKSQADRASIEGRLDISLYNNIANFDLTFIAALNLFKFSFEKITICLFFEGLIPNSEMEECYYRFGHFAAVSNLAYGKKIFGIALNRKLVEPNFFLKSLSGYLPFYYVSADSFERVFKDPIKSSWEQWWDNLKPDSITDLKNKSHQAKEIYQELRNHVIRNIDFKGDYAEQNILNYHIIYLFNAVRHFHFIKRILKNQLTGSTFIKKEINGDVLPSSLGIGLSRDADQEYEDRIQPIFDKILEKPPAFVMLFSYFIEMFYNPLPPDNASYQEKIKTRCDYIEHIFYFTDEIFYGIRELAKNIIEHSSNHRGVIIGRVLDREYLPDLKKEMFVDKYLQTRPKEDKEFIDLIVLDDGQHGIIDQTIKNLENLENKFYEYPDFVNKFKEDIGNLKIGNIKLDDFFNPEDIKLKYQEIRSAMSLGLLILSHLILENNGYLMVSSPRGEKVEGMALLENWSARQPVAEIVSLGTLFNLIFPKNLKKPPAPRSEMVPFEMPSGESAFNTMFQKVIRCEEKIKVKSADNDLKDKMCFKDFHITSNIKIVKRDEISNLFTNCRDCPMKNPKILSIDLKKNTWWDASDLFKFLSTIQLTRDIKSIILYNLGDEIVSRIIGIIETFQKMNRQIGSNDHFVLFYYQPLVTKDRHYPFLLAGQGMAEICWINNRLAKTINTGPLPIDGKTDWGNPDSQFKQNFLSNPMFIGNGHLLPFDVLIKIEGLSLFERNVRTDLLTPGQHPVSPSYTFTDAHMRLGSKIHLENFYYSRRIFQNSFYSLRFALLTSWYIEEHIADWLKPQDKDNKFFTVLGYGLYSELLISHVSRFLASIDKRWHINHAVIDDTEELRVHGEIKGKVIIIIPISSTLSTSHKIEMKVKKAHQKDATGIGNPISILVVGNGEIESICDEDGNVIDPTAKHFWEHLDKDKKIITTRSPKKQEKFFLYLPSRWYLPQECPRCFPKKPEEESVLFETDKVSVNPTLIYALPHSRRNTPLAEEICFAESVYREEKYPAAVITGDMLLYRHTTRGSNHYLFFVESTDFLGKNKKLLKTWLKKIKKGLTEKAPGIFDSRVILIAPTHHTNSDFISLVNETVFSDAATLFHYDQDEDYIQNLKTFFGHDMTSDAAIFFVDDVMLSGGTFERVNNFIKYARGGDESRGADGAFILLNRLMEDKYKVFARELNKFGIFAFVDLQVPSMIDTDRRCHLCAERNRYEKMLSETVLDSLRILIRKDIMRLGQRSYEQKDAIDNALYEDIEWKYVTREKCWFDNPRNQGKYLKQMEYVHRLYLACSDEEKRARLEEVFRDNGSLAELCHAVNIPCPQRWTCDDKVNLIKILSYPYFVFHQEIRKYIFRMVIQELEQTRQDLIKKLSSKFNIEYLSNYYRYLKFLILRAAILNANYLIRDTVIKEIFSLHRQMLKLLPSLSLEKKPDDIGPLFEKSKPELKVEELRENLHGFLDYYLLAVKETIWFNEARSLRLEETLDKWKPEKESDDATLLLLKHSLRIENISIPLQFVGSLEKDISSLDLSFTEQQYDADINKLSDHVIAYCQTDPYSASPLLSFLGWQVDTESIEREFRAIRSFLEKERTFQARILPMLLLKASFLQEKRKKGEIIWMRPDMDYILYCLCQTLGIDIKSGGAFFVVGYRQFSGGNKSKKATGEVSDLNFFTIGHIGKHREIETFDWERSFTAQIFSGYVPHSFKSLPLTLIEIVKDRENWITHYSEKIGTENISETEQMNEMKRYLFIRLADADLDSTARGVMVFYDQEQTRIAPENLRYALMLKNDLYAFIEKNFENYSRRSYEEKSLQLRSLRTLNREMIERITSAAALDKIFEAVKKARTTMPNIDEISLFEKKEGKYTLISKYPDSEIKGSEVGYPPELLEVIEKVGDPTPYYYCPNIEEDAHLAGIDPKGSITRLIIPLKFESRLLGILDIGSHIRDAFPPFERNLLDSLGAQVAIAINNRNKQEKQEEIFRDISHCLGTDLTTIRGYTQFLVDGVVTDEEKRKVYLKMILGEMLAFINSVDEISSLTEMERWDEAAITERLELLWMIKDLAEKNRFLLDEKQLILKISETEEKVFVRADKQKLEKAFQSLINNAIKFTDSWKVIEIRVKSYEENVVIEIADQGYGINEDELGRIFEKYERGRYAKEEKIPGTGIGLTVAKNIIERHSGEISVKSELGKGSTFTIKLPIFKEGKE